MFHSQLQLITPSYLLHETSTFSVFCGTQRNGKSGVADSSMMSLNLYTSRHRVSAKITKEINSLETPVPPGTSSSSIYIITEKTLLQNNTKCFHLSKKSIYHFLLLSHTQSFQDLFVLVLPHLPKSQRVTLRFSQMSKGSFPALREVSRY